MSSSKIPTGICSLDLRLEGGLSRQHITQVVGGPSSGRSRLGLILIAAAQRTGVKTLLVNTDNTYDQGWACQHGINPAELLILQGAVTVDDLLATIELVQPGLVVLDSLFHMQDQWLNNDSGVAYRTYISRLVKNLREADTALVITNQLRGVPGYTRPGIAGGRHLQSIVSDNIHLYPYASTDARYDCVSITVNHKLGRAWTPFDLRWGRHGVGLDADKASIGIQLGLLTEQGPWVYMKDGRKLGHGRRLWGIDPSVQPSESLWLEFCSSLGQALATQITKPTS